eukprot:356909-Chlamydomonas_euryale.AAC.3
MQARNVAHSFKDPHKSTKPTGQKPRSCNSKTQQKGPIQPIPHNKRDAFNQLHTTKGNHSINPTHIPSMHNIMLKCKVPAACKLWGRLLAV